MTDMVYVPFGVLICLFFSSFFFRLHSPKIRFDSIMIFASHFLSAKSIFFIVCTLTFIYLLIFLLNAGDRININNNA